MNVSKIPSNLLYRLRIFFNITAPVFLLFFIFKSLNISLVEIIDYVGFIFGAIALIFIFLNIDRFAIYDQTFIRTCYGPLASTFIYSWLIILLVHLFLSFSFWLFGFTFSELLSYNHNTKLILIYLWLVILYPISLLGIEFASNKNIPILDHLSSNSSKVIL